MKEILWVVIGVLLCVIGGLCWKIRLLRVSARQIREGFRDRLVSDTNRLLSISSRDPAMRQLASEINGQLRLLRGQRQRYQKGDREVKETIANLSHDLRTPLTAICGYLELLDGQPLPPDAARYVAQIEDRTRAMKSLTEELFQYSLAASEMQLHPAPVDLRRAVEESLLSFYGAFSRQGIVPQIDLTPPDGLFLLDGAALERILGNILTNALKYSAGDLQVTLDKEGRAVFSNRAPGMSALDAEQLFDRYYTVDSARRSAGLGLAIAKRLTAQMGGRIGAVVREGRLTVTVDFSAVRLPRQQEM